MHKLSGWDDTIVALATPQGIGAIGVIRLSGKKSFDIVNELFESGLTPDASRLTTKDLKKQKSHTLHVGYIKDGNTPIDEVVVSIFKGPNSYTGEDVIEISTHGSPFIQQSIIELCVRKGARLAKPGEFTQRAFLNGKLDLAQAEAIADLIASNTAASHRTSLHTMRGGFSEELKNLRDQLIKFSALIELELDFSQEDVEFADRKQFYDLIEQLTQSTNQLINSFQLGNVIRHGVNVAIIGKPNAGKSTLLNALLNEDRAIVSEIPGTTRDTIEEVINIDGILFRLIDTAGIREHTADLIESAGIERSLAKMKNADLIIYLFDSTGIADLRFQIADLKKADAKFLLVGNKIDEADEEQIRAIPLIREIQNEHEVILISAKNRTHLETLKRHMVDAVLQGTVSTENTIVTNARHYHALKEVAKSLREIRAGLDKKISGDLLALDIRRCLHYLGEITGEVTNEDQLDYIFSKFCIGK